MKTDRKRNAIHSGIGDHDDLLVKRPSAEEKEEKFKYAARLRGKKRHDTLIYPEVPFEYGVSYKGEIIETPKEVDYQFDVNAHPEKNLAFHIEETKEMPFKRLWEAEACFEGEVEKHNLKYAIEYGGTTGKMDDRTAMYAVGWEGFYNVKNHGDAKSIFTNTQGQYVGYSDGTTGWTMNGSHVDDIRNRAFFSGTIAKKSPTGASMYNWNAYEASFSFKPILNNGGTYSFENTKRFNASTGKFYAAARWDDDVVGLIFQAKDSKNFYMMMWEADEQIWGSSRAADNLDGINIFTDKDEYVQRSVVAEGQPPTRAQWDKHCNVSGWGNNHYRIYKVTNGVLKRVNVSMKGSGKGWIMNNMHRVRVVTNGKSVKIYGRTSPTATEFAMFDFQTDWGNGTFGMFNVSQSVEFHSIEIIERKTLTGRIPESGWDSTSDAVKTVATNATTYVRYSDSLKAKLPSGVAASSVIMTEINGINGRAANGTITIPSLSGSITVKSFDFSDQKSYSGRIPKTGWLQFDGIGDKLVATNALEFVREETGIADLNATSIKGIVASSKAGSITVPYITGPITIRNNNTVDAGEKYDKCYVRCNVVEITPDHRDLATGFMAFDDIAKVFAEDYAEFFSRPELINRKANYRLLQPVKTEAPLPPGGQKSQSGCEVPPPDIPEEEGDVNQCLNDFDFNGRRLVMWGCNFQVLKKKVLFEEKAFAYQGWRTLTPLTNFSPNKWTTYELMPIEETINKAYDEVKWEKRAKLEGAPAESKVVIRTLEWYRGHFIEGENAGKTNYKKQLSINLPAAPEQFFISGASVDDVVNRMPDSYDVIHYLLDGFANDPDITLSFLSDPQTSTDPLKFKDYPIALHGNPGMPIIKTSNGRDKVVVHCKGEDVYIPWSSGRYIGYGKVNGKRPFFGNGSGKADMKNVSTDVVYLPDDLVSGSLEGPFVDVYDRENPTYPRVRFEVSEDGKFIDFSSDHTDVHTWYTDWYSNWVEDEAEHAAFMTDSIELKDVVQLDPMDTKVSADYDPSNTILERIEVASDNPYVNLWIQDDKSLHSGLLGTYHRFPLTTTTFEEEFIVGGDYKEFLQGYIIESYMDRVEVKVDTTMTYKLLSVDIDGVELSESEYTHEGGLVKINAASIRTGMLSIAFSTGGVINQFSLQKDLGTYVEVYVNGRLLDQTKYSFNQRTMTINTNELFYKDVVNVQSYKVNSRFDPSKKNYLGEKQYSQLDFQEDRPSDPNNPNYNDMFYEGSLCFNWGYRAPERLIPEVVSAGFEPKYMYPDRVNFNYEVEMHVIYPDTTPIDISNFTGEWKQWDSQPASPGDWHGPPEEGYTEVTNLQNQNGYSGWYNPAHLGLKDYEFEFKVQARGGDDDMYGATFKFDEVTQSFYSFEWDGYWGMQPPSGGTGVKGMAVYKNVCQNPQDVGIATLRYTKTVLARLDISWTPSISEIHHIKVSTIGNAIKVWTDGILRFDISDQTDPFLTGAWGPVTVSQPSTYFWDFVLVNYKRVTPTEQPTFKKTIESSVTRPEISETDYMIEVQIDQEMLEEKFKAVLESFEISKQNITAIEYHIVNDTSDHEVYFKEAQTVRVLELSPSNLATNPLGASSIEQAISRFGNFDVAKTIVAQQDIYENFGRYNIKDYDVLTFTPADCNASTDLVSDEMMNWVRDFKNAEDKVVIFTHDTAGLLRFKTLLQEFGFQVATQSSAPSTSITLADPGFNYPYAVTGTIEVTSTHWNYVSGGTAIYTFSDNNANPWLSFKNNVYYSESGHSLYTCAGEFSQQLSDNEMKIWINMISRIAQWEAGQKPKITSLGQSKLYSTVRGQNPDGISAIETEVDSPPPAQIPLLEPVTELNPRDGFSISWSGYIYAKDPGVYKFKATVNDGFRLNINGSDIIDKWNVTGPPTYFPEYEASIYLEGDRWYPIRIQYFDNEGQALMRLHWAEPEQEYRRISPERLTPYLGYRLHAQVKKATPLNWSPSLHSGYYYIGADEHFLFADKQVLKKTPNEFHEVEISPRPQQGSPIIVRDNEGNILRKVTFYDDNWNLTLENKEIFRGNGHARYYLNYKGIDTNTLKVRVNGVSLMNTDYIFDEEKSSVEFMQKLGLEDEVEVKYILHYSYYLDINDDEVDGFVNKDISRIRLHKNYDPAKMVEMEIIYEADQESPFYRANEIAVNPLLTHNHTGFLYIAERGDQVVKDLTFTVSEKTLSISGQERVTLTARVTDDLNNPVPNKNVMFYREGLPIASLETNEAGEVYFYDQPKPTTSRSSVYRAVCGELKVERLLNYYQDNLKERNYLDVYAQKTSLLGGTEDSLTVRVTFRDKDWNPFGKGQTISIEKEDTKGNVTNTQMLTGDFGYINFNLSGLNEKNGTILLKFRAGGTEAVHNQLQVKVIGG